MISMVSFDGGDNTLVVRSLVTGETLYTLPNPTAVDSLSDAFSHQTANVQIQAFITDIQYLRLQKQIEIKQKQQQELQDVKDYIKQQQHEHLQSYMTEHKAYQEQYKKLIHERELILQEQQQQQQQQQQQLLQDKQQLKEQQQHVQQAQPQNVRPKRRNQHRTVHNLLKTNPESQSQESQPKQLIWEQQQQQQEQKQQQQNNTTTANGGPPLLNEEQPDQSHQQQQQQQVQNLAAILRTQLELLPLELARAAEHSLNYELPENQDNFLNLFNFFAIKFKREAILQQSATNAGIAPIDGLPQISYHLLSELSRELLESLDDTGTNGNNVVVHKKNGAILPPPETVSGELYQHFKQQFLNGYKYYQKHLSLFQAQLNKEETRINCLQAPPQTDGKDDNDEQRKKTQKEQQMARAKAKRQAKRLQLKQAKAHEQRLELVQQQELLSLLQQQQQKLSDISNNQQQSADVPATPATKANQQPDASCSNNNNNDTSDNSTTRTNISPINVTGENMPECRIRRTYSCAHCRNVTQNPRLYLLHLRNVHGRCNTIYMCPSCQYATQRCQKFVRHMKSIHGLDDALTLAQSPSCKLPYDGVPPRRRRYTTN